MPNKNILYTHFDGWEEYHPAVVVKCDVCNKMFQVKKGFYLEGNVITCFKHFKNEPRNKTESTK